MEPLGPDVRRELARFGPAGGGMAEIVRAWPAAVGETVARNAWPARLARDGTLHVAASSSTWAFELGNLAGDILARLRDALGEAAPPRLRFAPGALPAPAPEGPREQARPPRPGLADATEAAAIAASVEDPELRELVARAAAASLARARSGRAL